MQLEVIDGTARRIADIAFYQGAAVAFGLMGMAEAIQQTERWRNVLSEMNRGFGADRTILVVPQEKESDRLLALVRDLEWSGTVGPGCGAEGQECCPDCGTLAPSAREAGFKDGYFQVKVGDKYVGQTIGVHDEDCELGAALALYAPPQSGRAEEP
jgi:hypothetical protein